MQNYHLTPNAEKYENMENRGFRNGVSTIGI
jgi:hypothetical protein